MKRNIVIISLVILIVLTSACSLIGYKYSKIRNKIEDNFLLNGNDKVVILYGQSYYDDGYSFNNGLIEKPNITTLSNVDTQKVGKYEVKYTIQYKNYYKSIVREVNVVDKDSPIISIDCDDEEYLEVNTKFKGCNYIVNDNYDKSNKIKVDVISNLNENKVGDYTITWKAKDSNNNINERKIVVHVRKRDDLNYINISISKQRLDYYENGKLYLTTPITSGKYNKTPKGNFRVFNKATNTILKSGNYAVFVKYWIGFKGYRFGIHDASWRKKFGTKDYYTNGSHGCVNTPDDAVEKLYKRVKVGMPIHIYD